MSVTHAAAEYSISQPSMTARMTRLTKLVNCERLYVVKSHKLTLTEDGVKLKEKAEKLLATYDELVKEFEIE